ncbi:MAG: ABC transporter ATP-binding protein [Polyangiaceae bacterium]
MSEALLSVKHLRTSFPAESGKVFAVDDVSFEVGQGETLAIVGESGCGKSMTAFSVLRLVPHPGKIESGELVFQGQDLARLSEKDMRSVRGARISMIFQEPMTSLNPVYSVGSQIGEVLRLHRKLSRRQARLRAVELLKLVGIPSPESRVDSYPHQLSGGMRQRVMIAMALACEPALLLADEPTTALDVTIQAQILDLLRRLQGELGMSIVFITHDLGVVAEFASRVVVMYAGRVVENASVKELFRAPQHPYTRGLLASVPPMGGGERPPRLNTIEGVVPSLAELPKGCRFAARCALRRDGGPEFKRCEEEEPDLLPVSSGHASRCFFNPGLPSARTGTGDDVAPDGNGTGARDD